MTLYVDSSALLKRYLVEPDSERADEVLGSDDQLLTARHTTVEVRRNLSRALTGAPLTQARRSFQRDLGAFSIIELSPAVCDAAITIAEHLGVRTLDALHLGALQQVGGVAVTLLTFDLRQAQAARSLGYTVLGC